MVNETYKFESFELNFKFFFSKMKKSEGMKEAPSVQPWSMVY